MIKKSKSLTRKIKELAAKEAVSLKVDLNSVKSNLFPVDNDKPRMNTTVVPALIAHNSGKLLSSESHDARPVGVGSLSAVHNNVPLRNTVLPGVQSHHSSPSISNSHGKYHNTIPSLGSDRLSALSQQSALASASSGSSSSVGDPLGLDAPQFGKATKLASISPAVLSTKRIKTHSVGSGTDRDIGPILAPAEPVVLGEAQVAAENDRLIQDRLQEAKAMSRKNESGAVMHQFSLWSRPASSVAAALPNESVRSASMPRTSSRGDMSWPHEVEEGAGRSGKVRGPKAAITLAASNQPDLLTGSDPGAADAEDDWSAYSSDFESCAVNAVADGDEGWSHSEDGPGGSVPGSSQKGLASSLRSKVVDAKQLRSSVDSAADVTEITHKLGSSLPLGAFDTPRRGSTSAIGANNHENNGSEHMNFSQSIDSATFRRHMQQSVATPVKSPPTPLAEPLVAVAATLRSQSVQLQDARLTDQQADLSNRRARSASTSTESTHTGEQLQGVAHSGLVSRMSSLTARAASALSESMQQNSHSNSSDQERRSKYQALKELRSREHDREAAAEKLVLTSFDSSTSSATAAFLLGDGIAGQLSVTGSAAQLHDPVDREDAASPALSELSETEEPLGEVRRVPVEIGAPSGFETASDTNRYHNNLNTALRARQQQQQQQQSSLLDDFGSSGLQWRKGEAIGEGTFGKVFKGLNERTGELLAIKQLCIADGSDSEVESLRREIRVMWDLDSRYVVRYLGTSRSDRYLYIILEYITGGSVASMLAQFGEFSEPIIQ